MLVRISSSRTSQMNPEGITHLSLSRSSPDYSNEDIYAIYGTNERMQATRAIPVLHPIYIVYT